MKNPSVVKPSRKDLDLRPTFLIASARSELTAFCRLAIEEAGFRGKTLIATDGAEALEKTKKDIPHVAILDGDISKVGALDVAEKLLEIYDPHRISIVLMMKVPDEHHFVDEVVTGQVQFTRGFRTEADLLRVIAWALDCLTTEKGKNTYRLRFLAAREILFEEGEKAESVFFVKKGSLEVYNVRESSMKYVGMALPNEFVGEMAHLNREPRSACVRAVEACELIEIPCQLFDKVLFTKPAWAKALVETLSRRLKDANEKLEKAGAR